MKEKAVLISIFLVLLFFPIFYIFISNIYASYLLQMNVDSISLNTSLKGESIKTQAEAEIIVYKKREALGFINYIITETRNYDSIYIFHVNLPLRVKDQNFAFYHLAFFVSYIYGLLVSLLVYFFLKKRMQGNI